MLDAPERGTLGKPEVCSCEIFHPRISAGLGVLSVTDPGLGYWGSTHPIL